MAGDSVPGSGGGGDIVARMEASFDKMIEKEFEITDAKNKKTPELDSTRAFRSN